jgi:hypothetical protein
MANAAALVVTQGPLVRASVPIPAVDEGNAQVAHVCVSLDGRVQTALFKAAAMVMEAAHLLTRASASRDGRVINAKLKSNAPLPIVLVMESVPMGCVSVSLDLLASGVT